MTILTRADLPLAAPVAMTIGFFDGVHTGHRRLIRTLKEQPEKSLVYTFSRKPNVPKPLFSAEERAAIFACEGIDYFYIQDFDVRLEAESARQFLRSVMRSFHVKAMVVGSDFRFGSGAAGDVELLREMSGRYGYKLLVVPLQEKDARKVGSTELRRLIRCGDIRGAEEKMHRRYFIDGVVESGAQLGSRIGFPTANITSDKLMPAYGVYATLTKTPDGIYPSVTNIGTKPTIKHDNQVTIETNLLDTERKLYGQPIRVYFIDYLRPEKEFQSVDQLRRQILKDANRARRLLSNPDVYSRLELC